MNNILSKESHKEKINKAQNYIDLVKDEVKKSKYRQGYHFMAPAGWINDPNGCIYYKGEYHLFYQHNPYSHEWASMHWGHAVSKDLVNWEHLPVALAPSEFYDDDEKGGCFSGSAVDNNGQLTLMYTGTINEGGKSIQTQCIAISEDGINFEKHKQNPVIPRFPIDGDFDFRDPKAWRENDTWYVVIGSTKDNDGKALLYKSDDLVSWDYIGVLAESNGNLGTMWECPDFFKLGNKYVLIMSPMELEGRKTVYLVGDMDFNTGKFTYETEGEIDWGFDYYAPQSLLDDKGRRIVIGWQNSWPWMDWFNGFGPTEEDKWNGCMSIPRVVELDENNRLKFKPVEEIKSLRGVGVNYRGLSLREEYFNLEIGNGINYDIDLNINLEKTTAREFKLELRVSEQHKTIVSFDLDNKKMTMDRNNCDGYLKGIRSCDLELNNDILNIRILSDNSSIEVYADDYKSIMTSNLYVSENEKGIRLKALDGTVYIESLEGYELRTIF